MRIRRSLAIGLIAATACMAACNKAPEPAVSSEPKPAANPNLVRLDPALDQLVAPTAAIDKVATGFQFLEGPLWRSSGDLWFSDLVGNILYRIAPDGKMTQLLKPGGTIAKSRPRAATLVPME